MPDHGVWAITPAGECLILGWMGGIVRWTRVLTPEGLIDQISEIFEEEFIIGPKSLELAKEAYGLYNQKFPGKVPEVPEKIDFRDLF